jgi:cell division protein FtsL
MKRSLGVIVVVLILAAVGVAALMTGVYQRRMAIAQEDMVVLDFDDPQADYAALQQDLAKWPLVSRQPLEEIRKRRALLQYWQGDYTDLVELARTASQSDEPLDPEIQILAANALYRVAQHGPQDKATVLRNLDAVIRAYAEALRAGSDRPDTAFNYELAVRIREEISSGRRKGGMPNSQVDETKSDPNMHGDPGEPPKDMKVEQFQIRIPMDPKEIKNSQEQTAGTGQQRKRKG